MTYGGKKKTKNRNFKVSLHGWHPTTSPGDTGFVGHGEVALDVTEDFCIGIEVMDGRCTRRCTAGVAGTRNHLRQGTRGSGCCMFLRGGGGCARTCAAPSARGGGGGGRVRGGAWRMVPVCGGYSGAGAKLGRVHAQHAHDSREPVIEAVNERVDVVVVVLVEDETFLMNIMSFKQGQTTRRMSMHVMDTIVEHQEDPARIAVYNGGSSRFARNNPVTAGARRRASFYEGLTAPQIIQPAGKPWGTIKQGETIVATGNTWARSKSILLFKVTSGCAPMSGMKSKQLKFSELLEQRSVSGQNLI
ncbi:hypothetical protein C8F04DRAFT_1189250 [Mycena alexandri]|uniref:Uncharacterized protein n=1 Tax=Mycena alexandri TaxID=1745969 RepID=A0AAD6SIB2_9AGAR|nr:hypothetical protein C8F04DRAFT_1189250 [Mycena alexandri]